MNNKEKEKELNNQIDALMLERKELRQQMAEDSCPFVIGTKLVNKDGNKAMISSISYSGYGQGYDLKIKKIKKNGELYLDSQYYYGHEWTPDPLPNG